ncbi:hypothetical protein OG579_17185 [Williamsia herbipolensis]|uniref:Thioesterase domain-containing protein n=1 Tax=Williamsia herbipolensis TaxID=1603258 RepID=A0AAU4K0A9_9NOCA|nr:hypothetical protein [Williamsia herbipolensis]
MTRPRLILFRGTGEPLHGGMLGPLTHGLPAGVDVVEAAYRAEIPPLGTQPLPASVAQGRRMAVDLDRHGPWVGAGYSLGAYLLGHAVAADHLQNCLGVVLLADPLRDRRQVSNNGVGRDRWGIAGERWVPGRVRSYAIPDDPITALSRSNPMRFVSDLVTGRRQPFGGLWPAGAGASAVWRYAATGRHTAYGVERMPGDHRTYVEAARDDVLAMLS